MKRICVLIPAYNEEIGVRRSIVSCLNAGMSREDIYVINDGSKDDTSEVARHYKVNVLDKPNGGKASALVAGIDTFKLCENYEYVALLDADSTTDKDYFIQVLKTVDKFPNAALICGCQHSTKPEKFNWIGAWRATEYAIWCGVYREAQHMTGTIQVAPGFGSIYKTTVLPKLEIEGGTIVEDMDMTIQLQRMGELIVYAPDAHVYTQDPKTFKDYYGQMMRWYRGTWQVIRKHKLGRGGQIVDAEVALLLGESVLFGALMIFAPIIALFFPKAVMWSLVLDQLIAGTFVTMVAIRERRLDVIYVFPLALIFRVMGYFICLRSYFLERKATETQWFSVARY